MRRIDYPRGQAMIKCKNIFDLIDLIQKRTAMFIPDKSINSLKTYLDGYDTCMWVHGIIELDVPMFKHFGEWLVRMFNYQFTSYGWAYAIQNTIDNKQDPLQLFFQLVREFRKLHPHMVTRVKIEPHHQPTGMKSINGTGEQISKPIEIQVIQYKPEGLFFVRHCYKARYEHSYSLFPSIKEAKNQVEIEFQVISEEWIC